MTGRPRLLDLFCGGGGAAMGYARAGFVVVGVDIAPQPHYPFHVHQADALAFLQAHGHEFDAVHASPPCQKHSTMTNVSRARGNRRDYADLIAPTRDALVTLGKPWVIENVMGAPLRVPTILCGSMFGLAVRRHRGFESPWVLKGPSPCSCRGRRNVAVYGKRPGDRLPDGVQRARDLAHGAEAMGIAWLPWASLTQAIPPAYTECIGGFLRAAVQAEAVA